MGAAEGGGCGGATVAAVAGGARSRKSGDNIGGHVNTSNHIVAGVADEEVFAGIKEDSIGVIQGGRRGGAAISTVACHAGSSCKGGDRGCSGIDAADAMISGVGDVEEARPGRTRAGSLECGFQGADAVDGGASCPSACEETRGARDRIIEAEALIIGVLDDEGAAWA